MASWAKMVLDGVHVAMTDRPSPLCDWNLLHAMHARPFEMFHVPFMRVALRGVAGSATHNDTR